MTLKTTQMKAIKVVEAHKAEIQDSTLPKLRDDCVLCKVNWVAINPTDWKHIDFVPAPGATSGCDFAGSVEWVGPTVKKDWKIGDRVAAFAHGCNASNLEDGCFAEYALVKGDLQMKIPDSLSDEQATTLGVGIVTVGQALFQKLGLPLPPAEHSGDLILINGGSTATGSLAIQMANLSGYTVITTCSPRNFGFTRSLGASKAFNYKDPACGKKIRDYTNGRLKLAFDCISEGNSARLCCEALADDDSGSRIVYLNPISHPRGNVESSQVLAYTVNGEAFDKGTTHVSAAPEDLEFGKRFWELATELFAKKLITTHPSMICEGGLQGVIDGLDMLRAGKISRKKLVYRVQ
ncbi:putative zinc-binding oxidoreductase ToxD [Xylaria bambusicola]|uniref:putative zinc-binding oxidoreductase ToxD n=1 Tax=Xylaria bambusicola TaxID=326684 RepID=UPI002008AB2C|nr:putative zinc-binding oxidoreductase ToxD [Xylaria bambusicola]KAI0508527.1 putative zinc-binding oxidoreductase ToxD [Xylaria bambusicola]